ncbi:MAG: CooT family nickel-binding protein [Desulfobulbaceae bacterium]|nr:CooT family nickel-binding protein [Desulfobulbaceae bacterium]
MCQIKVVVEKKEQREIVAEGVTGLEQSSGGVLLKTFFEEPLMISDVSIKSIDFLGGTVLLSPSDIA